MIFSFASSTSTPWEKRMVAAVVIVQAHVARHDRPSLPGVLLFVLQHIALETGRIKDIALRERVG